jgi:ATP synthase protein I
MREFDDEDDEQTPPVPLTNEQAQQLRRQLVHITPLFVVLVQLLATLVVGLSTWALTFNANWALSVAYGGLSIALPAGVFAWAMRGKTHKANAAGVLFGFFLWESIKVLLSVVMLVIAPFIIPNLSWLALLAGLIVTIKAYLIAAFLRSKGKR